MSLNWEVNVNFKVSGKGKDLYGDGFAIWYARDRLITGPVFGSKDLFMGLAIILDTYSNHNGQHNVSFIKSNFYTLNKLHMNFISNYSFDSSFIYLYSINIHI